MLGGGGGWSVEKTGISAMIISSQIPFSIDLHYTEVKIQLSGPLLQGLTSRGGVCVVSWKYRNGGNLHRYPGLQGERELPHIALQQ